MLIVEHLRLRQSAENNEITSFYDVFGGAETMSHFGV